MILSANNLNEVDYSEADTIIVGAGAVGLMMAVDLARNGHSVLLLEAGSAEVNKSSQRFFENAISTGRTLDGLHLGRFRALGGTTNFWGGQLVRFDPIVFNSRPWVNDDTAWPISRNDLDPFYDKALTMLGIEKAVDSDESVMHRLGINPPRLSDSLNFFFTRWLPEPNLARWFNKEIHQLPTLKVLVDAPVVSLVSDDKKVIDAVEVLDGKGRRILFRAKNIVLANGTIEAARLLSLPLSDGTRPNWSVNPWLGRGFMDHMDCIVGEIKPKDKKRFHHVFDNAFVDGVKYQPKLKLSEFAQQDQKLLGIACHFIFNSSISEHLTNAKIFFRALLKGRLNGSLLDFPRQLLTLLTVGLPMIVRYIRYRRMYNPADQGIHLRLTGEQCMVVESGLKLSDKLDALGMPLVEIDWRVDGSELETIAIFSEKVRDYLVESGLADVTLDSRVTQRDPSFLSTFDDANHHMGMIRMSNDVAKGVVDPNLRVYGSQNLYVAGAAVYPSTGFANPTFTAMALGLRLSATLQKGVV